MFTSTNPTSFNSILDGINTKVTMDMNAKLTKCFAIEEVEQALKKMKPMTAPGPNGMPPLFYKAYWCTVGPDVIDATPSVLNSEGLHSLTKQAENNGSIRVVSLCKDGPEVWRLIQNTDSLFYKVFKAKYFPHCTILDDEVKMKGSYAWQSILKARSLVCTGSTWRIGNGEKVLIRGENWLPNQSSRQVISPQKIFPNNTNVCALIDDETPCWLEERVCEELMPREANVILSIPISSRQPEDTLIWQKSKNGVYTTKSAYRLLADSKALKQPGQSNPTANNGLWKKLWSPDILNKDTYRARIGVVIRDSEGKVLSALSNYPQRWMMLKQWHAGEQLNLQMRMDYNSTSTV
ncbi:hypothetical protein SO802_001756 [Lithocarpus litseifolius]|uniref:Uncharacterized protein n=1 Tax=Lithocarpus litseifolius TaxID=425828 RepID=A0AAW2DY11_9ROSI